MTRVLLLGLASCGLDPRDCVRSCGLLRVLRSCEFAGLLPGARPTVDFALAAIERVLGLPRGAAFTLFAAGRVTGWIAHAMEQTADGRLIRPRARYVGEAGGAV